MRAVSCAGTPVLRAADGHRGEMRRVALALVCFATLLCGSASTAGDASAGGAASSSNQRPDSISGRTITVVTATNTRFYKQELSLLRALRALKYGKRYRLIVYDLGMTKEEASALRCAAPTLADEVRTFDFDKYPR